MNIFLFECVDYLRLTHSYPFSSLTARHRAQDKTCRTASQSKNDKNNLEIQAKVWQLKLQPTPYFQGNRGEFHR